MKYLSSQPERANHFNRYKVYNLLAKEKLLSRPQIAKLSGLSRAGVAMLVDDMLRMNLAQEIGFGDSQGGRPPVLLRFNPDGAYALGACMHDSQWAIVVTNLDARVIERELVSVAENSPEAAVAALGEGVKNILQRVDSSRILGGIGLGLPGLVDIRTGIVKGAYDIGWIDVPITDMVKEATGYSVIAANRSKVCALAAMHHMAAEGIQNLIYVTIGTGVSAGIIYHGDLYVGTNSNAGELGHMTILPEGPLCKCGNRGCLQELVSEEAIASIARRRLKNNPSGALADKAGNRPELMTARDVIQAAEAGDATAAAVIDEIGSYLAIGIGNLINLLNPELIVLGGPVADESSLLLEVVRREVRLRALTFPLAAVEIVRSSLGVDAGAIGASVLVLKQSAKLLF